MAGLQPYVLRFCRICLVFKSLAIFFYTTRTWHAMMRYLAAHLKLAFYQNGSTDPALFGIQELPLIYPMLL